MGKLFVDVYVGLKKSDKFKNAFLDLNSTAILGTIAATAQEYKYLYKHCKFVKWQPVC